ncbi:MAG: hypothetical protein JWP03_2894 [Phycisphaerales bacterium]|jgi:transposase-like protein|nr:hypothetical protein [Phycisphaerales bacterium]
MEAQLHPEERAYLEEIFRKQEERDRAGVGSALEPMQPLNAFQNRAMIAIMEGATMSEAAKAAGVDRSTLYRWRTTDPSFRRSLIAWRVEQVDAAYDRLATLAGKATAAIDKAIEKGDARLAFRVLEKIGVAKARTYPPEEVRTKEGWVVELINVGDDRAGVSAVLQKKAQMIQSTADAIVAFNGVRRVTGPIDRLAADTLVREIEAAGGRATVERVRCIDTDEELWPGDPPQLIGSPSPL